MKRQAIVIGLGQFGLSVARALAKRNVEVLAIDTHEDRIRAAMGLVTETALMDATHEDSLARTSPDRRDVCICAIGDEAREASIICTALLRQLGSKRIIARANDDLHARILTLVGAHQVVNPERDFGERFANQIVHEGIRGEMPLGDGLLITEADVPLSLVGHSLGALQLPKKFGITVVAIRRALTGSIVLPTPHDRLESGDVLVVVAREGAVAKMLERS